MQTELWIPTEPDTIHRIDARTGSAVKPPLTAPNCGVLSSKLDSEHRICAYSGQGSTTVIELDVEGVVTGTYRRSGPDIVAIEKDALDKDVRRHQHVVVGPSGREERWTYHPPTGNTMREEARSGKPLGELRLPAGGMIVAVRVPSSTG